MMNNSRDFAHRPYRLGQNTAGRVSKKKVFKKTAARISISAKISGTPRKSHDKEIVSRLNISFLEKVLNAGALLEDKDFPIAKHILDWFCRKKVSKRMTLLF